MPATTAAPESLATYRARLESALLDVLPELIARTAWPRERILDHQRDRLRTLLQVAAARSPFHARRLAGIDPDAVDPRDLSALPVMTKATMMDEFDDVFTDRRLHRRLVEDVLSVTVDEPRPILDEYLAFSSGGSSGRRGVFVLDPGGLRQFLGSLCRGLVARIEQTGGPPPGGLPIAMVAAGSAVHPTGGTTRLVGDALPFRFVPVPATLPLPEIVERLNAMAAPLLYGYPSMLARLAAEQRAGRLRIQPSMITVTSETLTPELRAAIREGFGVPIINTFGSTEGLVGSSAPDGEAIVFAEDGCIVELVDDEHRLVAPGTPATSILITNLENHVQPLIRYELGDVATARPADAGDGHLRATVEGRSDEVLHFGSVSVHPFAIRSVLVKSSGVADFQVRQTADGLDVTVAVEESEPRSADLAERLQAALVGAGLDDPRVTVALAPALHRDPHTGKLRRFVPLPGRVPRQPSS